jgi:soluble lytic murein transglycosylase-like protein
MDIQLYAKNIQITIQTEAMLQGTSWGLMQVMGTVARELGHSAMLTQLADPEIGVNLGTLKLRRLLDYYGLREDAISAYNQGGTKKSVTGAYLNQGYVDSVLSRMGKINEILSKGET